MTTIGGVAFRHLDRLPKVGDKVIVEDVAMTVLEMDNHRIARLRVTRGGDDEEQQAGESSAVVALADAESRPNFEAATIEPQPAPAVPWP